MSPDIAASIREQIDKLDEKTYAVKRKWDVLECDNEVYICKIAQKNGIALGCIVNVKSILEPFSKLSLGKHGYVSLVDQDEVCIGMLDQDRDFFRRCLKPDGGKSARDDSIDLYDSYYEWDIAFSCVFQYYETA